MILKFYDRIISLLRVYDIQYEYTLNSSILGFVPVIDFDVGVCDRIVLESHELEVEDGREVEEDNAFLGLLQPVLAGIVLVVPVQRFLCYVVLERLMN